MGKVHGILQNLSFVNESEGILRIITTINDDNKSYNVYCLDNLLKIVGSLTGIAADREINNVVYV